VFFPYHIKVQKGKYISFKKYWMREPFCHDFEMKKRQINYRFPKEQNSVAQPKLAGKGELIRSSVGV